MEANFFWRGDNFGFLESLVINSHLKVGHIPIIWLSGSKPDSQYWKDIEKKITIKNSDDIFNIDEFISTGGNFRTAASLWRFNFLYKFGGLYCDTDAFALKKFPDDKWIACSAREEPQWLYIGVLKAPPNQKVYLDCISNAEKPWGNVKVFTEAYRKNFGNINPSHDGHLFYPYTWKDWEKLLSKEEIPTNVYSIHFYTKGIEEKSGKGFNYYNEHWCEKNPDSMLARLWSWIKDEGAMNEYDKFNTKKSAQNNTISMKFSKIFNFSKRSANKKKPEGYGSWWQEKNTEFYDKIYDDTPKLDVPFKEWLSKLDDFNSVLEIGCGDGRQGKNLFESKTYHGLDLNKNIIKKNIDGNKNNNHSYRSSDFISDEYYDNLQYDLVYSLSVIDHVYDIDSFIKKCVKIAKKYVWITAYYGYHPDLKKHEMRWHEKFQCYHNKLSVKKLEELLTSLNVKFSIKSFPYVDRGKATAATNIIIEK